MSHPHSFLWTDEFTQQWRTFHQNLLSSRCVPNTGNTAVTKMDTGSALMSFESNRQPADHIQNLKIYTGLVL